MKRVAQIAAAISARTAAGAEKPIHGAADFCATRLLEAKAAVTGR